MSLKGILEFALHIKKFRNIDLFESGFYYVRFSIAQESNKKKYFARPFSMAERTPGGPKDPKPIKPVIRPHILHQSSSYVTKTFCISLCEEEITFNEACYFRVDFTAFPRSENSAFYLEVDLMFADFTNFSDLHGTDEEKLAGFRKITSFRARLKNPEEGLHEYLPILFDQRHCCVLQTTLHSSTLNLRMKTEHEELSQPDQKGSKDNILVIQAKNLRNLFSKKSKLTAEPLDRFYIEYVSMLKLSYQRLVEFCAYVIQLYSQESNQFTFLKFLEGTPAKEAILEMVHHKKIKEAKDKFLSSPYEEQKAPETIIIRPISEALNSKDPDLIIFAIVQEMISLSANAFHTWRTINEMMLELPKSAIFSLQNVYNEKLKNHFKDKLIQKIYRTSDLILSFEQNIGESHTQIANSKRATLASKRLDPSPSLFWKIEDVQTYLPFNMQPIVFEEICVKNNFTLNPDAIISKIEKNLVKPTYNGVHLIVLCHGFQGSSHDLRLLKNTINNLYPETLQLCASSNEDLTDDEISKMGIRLATEVKSYIEEWVRDVNLGRLSFIGHSLGGLIIRAALPYLEQYASKMHLFMTLSAPHLGYISHSSKLVESGMWFLSKWKKSKCLEELSLSDASEIEDTFIYKLSRMKGVNWFKHILLLSSYQDQYAPYESARIQVSKKANQDPSKRVAYEKMAANILSEISADCVYRIDVDFPIPEKSSLDTMLGRAAHIQFLESRDVGFCFPQNFEDSYFYLCLYHVKRQLCQICS